jgi:hypothetical protein
LPSELNSLALYQPALIYDLLFSSAWQTLFEFTKQKELQGGMIAILHTWGQNLSLHPHLHCIVPGGGITKEKKWKIISKEGKFLFPVKAMSKVFRGKYLAALKTKQLLSPNEIDNLYGKPWVIYAKRPFGGPFEVIEYLGRYTHKIAISNHRLKNVDEQEVAFDYKDYKIGGIKKIMKLPLHEFIRRFAQHILPRRFVRIRHYGILSSTWKRQQLKDLQKSLKVKQQTNSPNLISFKKCACCKTGNLITLLTFDKRGPPKKYLGEATITVPYEK